MTKEQLKRGEEIQKEIEALKKRLIKIESLSKKGVNFVDVGNNSDCVRIANEELAEDILYKVKWQTKAKIDRLEREFSKL